MKKVEVFGLWKDILDRLMSYVENFPKKVRFTVTNRLINHGIDVLELITRAMYESGRDKVSYLEECNIKINIIRILLRISYERRYISLSRYEELINSINRAGRMIGG